MMKADMCLLMYEVGLACLPVCIDLAILARALSVCIAVIVRHTYNINSDCRACNINGRF